MSNEYKEKISQIDIESRLPEQEERYKALLEEINHLQKLLKEKEDKIQEGNKLLDRTTLVLEGAQSDIIILQKLNTLQKEQIAALEKRNDLLSEKILLFKRSATLNDNTLALNNIELEKNDKLVLLNQQFADELQQRLALLSIEEGFESNSTSGTMSRSQSTNFRPDSPVLGSNHESDVEDDVENTSKAEPIK